MNIIGQSVRFNESPDSLFDAYLDSRKHSAIVDSKVSISKAGRGARVDLVHVNVPKHDLQGVTRGWRRYYWKPWLEYLKRSRR